MKILRLNDVPQNGRKIKDIKFFCELANFISIRRSTCVRKKVAAIAVKDGRVISTGWNGVGSGKKHCCEHDWDIMATDFYKKHGEFSKENEFHAEENLIKFANDNDISLDDCDIFITLSPCVDCANKLVKSNVGMVFYTELYDRCTKGLSVLDKNNIKHFYIPDYVYINT